MMASTEQRMRARAAALHWHRKIRPARARCGARRKYDGQPCQQIGMANGRCAYHGGLTPRGDNWHKPRWPNPDAPDAEQKLARKLRDLERAAKKRAARVAAMSPEERRRYDAWQRACKPGPAAVRAAARQARKQAAAFAKSLSEKRPANPEAEAIQREIDKLERRAASARGFDIFG